MSPEEEIRGLKLQLEAFQEQARRLAADNARLLREQADQAQRMGAMQANHARVVAGLVVERDAAERKSWNEAALARAAERRAEEALRLAEEAGALLEETDKRESEAQERIKNQAEGYKILLGGDSRE